MFRIDFSNQILKSDMLEMERRVPEASRLDGKRVYISGASGMIASYLVAYLIWLNLTRSLHIEIYAGIRSREKAAARFGEYQKQPWFHVIMNDVSQPLDEKLRFDYMVHAASSASPQFYGMKPVEIILPNVIGTNELLCAARRSHLRGSFVFFSTESMYGDMSLSVEKITEEMTGDLDYLHQGNLYGESKRCGEALGLAYYREYEVPFRAVRIAHTYGPTMDVEGDSRVFAEFTGDIVHGRDIHMRSDGSTRRTFCYITDNVVGVLKVLLEGVNGEIYNLANDEEYLSIAELAEVMKGLFPERKLRVIRDERNQKGYIRREEHRCYRLDTGKLRSLGWSPEVCVREGFRRSVVAIEEQMRK